MSEPRYPFVAIDVAPDDAELASYELFELGALGVEERDDGTLAKGKSGMLTLVASFASHEDAESAIAALGPTRAARLEEVVGDGWRDAWKEHFHPFEICPGVVVQPPWEPYEQKGDERVLVLEPGRAFGTGLHETTSLVATTLAERAAALGGARVLDVGTGSGILALVALELGASHATCTDIDPEAVAVTLENAQRNGLEARIEASTTDVSELSGEWPFVLANIEARVLVPMATALMARVAPRGTLVLSGILAPQEDDVRAAYARFAHVATRRKGEWIALELCRAEHP